MLKSGSVVFDCRVDTLLGENKLFHHYSVHCSDDLPLKLIYIPSDLCFSDDQRQSFFEFAEALSRQKISGVGTLVKAGDVDGQPACLYSIPVGTKLAKNFGVGFNSRQAVTLIRDLVGLLIPPHRAGFCHGNISPQTIYLDETKPALADFSLCSLLPLDYQSGIDPCYTSPEQVRGEKPDCGSDIYNLGCVFYRLVAGSAPFSGSDPFAVARQHLSEEFPQLPEELSLLQPVLDAMTAVAVEKRISAPELSQQLAQLLDNPEIDHICPVESVSPPDREIDCSDESVSLFNDPTALSEMAARVEARLMENADQIFDDPVTEIPGSENDQILPEESGGRNKKRVGSGRIFLILIVGIVLGFGLRYSLNTFSVTDVIPPAKKVEEPKNLVDLDQGLRLWKNKDFNGAEAEFKKVIALYPEDPRAYNNLAAFYAAQGNYEQARDYLEKALATDEAYATIYHNLGAVYAEMARGSYGRALRLAKRDQAISLPVFSSQGVIAVEPVDRTENDRKNEPSGVAAIVDMPKKVVEEPQPVVAVAAKDNGAESVAEAPIIAETGRRKESESAADSSAAVTLDENAVAEQNIEATPAPEAVVEMESPQEFLQRWAQAWSAQDVDAYLSFYAAKFVPPGGRNRQVWEKQRQQRLTRPKSIHVSLENLQLTPQGSDKVQVEALQIYQSDVFSDKTRKVFDLQRDDNSWKIVRERSLGAVR